MDANIKHQAKGSYNEASPPSSLGVVKERYLAVSTGAPPTQGSNLLFARGSQSVEESWRLVLGR